MPISPYIFVSRGNGQISINWFGDVKVWAQSHEDVFNWPFELRQQVQAGSSVDGDVLSFVNSDQTESDSFDVNVVDFWVDEDVVDVQTDVWDGCGGNQDTLRDNNGFFGDEASVRNNGSFGGCSIQVSVLVDLESEFQVSWGNKDQIVLVGNVNSNETLSVWNGYGSN